MVRDQCPECFQAEEDLNTHKDGDIGFSGGDQLLVGPVGQAVKGGRVDDHSSPMVRHRIKESWHITVWVARQHADSEECYTAIA